MRYVLHEKEHLCRRNADYAVSFLAHLDCSDAFYTTIVLCLLQKNGACLVNENHAKRFFRVHEQLICAFRVCFHENRLDELAMTKWSVNVNGFPSMECFLFWKSEKDYISSVSWFFIAALSLRYATNIIQDLNAIQGCYFAKFVSLKRKLVTLRKNQLLMSSSNWSGPLRYVVTSDPLELQ